MPRLISFSLNTSIAAVHAFLGLGRDVIASSPDHVDRGPVFLKS